MNEKLKTEHQTQETKTAECDKAVSLRHGLYFDELKKLSPKSFKLVIDSFQIDDSLLEIRYHSNEWLRQNLFYFFDSQNIYVNVAANLYAKYNWTIIINSPGKPGYDVVYNHMCDYNSRIEAETSSFIRAFEILEQKI